MSDGEIQDLMFENEQFRDQVQQLENKVVLLEQNTKLLDDQRKKALKDVANLKYEMRGLRRSSTQQSAEATPSRIGAVRPRDSQAASPSEPPPTR